MIAYLPRFASLQLLPAGCADGRFGFYIDPRLAAQNRFKAVQKRRNDVVPERRVEKNDIEPLFRTSEVGVGVSRDDLHLGGAKLGAAFFQRRERDPVALDQHDARGAARSGLEPERAAARVQIEAREARQILTKPVEERLPHAIGRRPQSRARGDAQAPAAELSADDAEDSRRSRSGRIHASMVAASSWAARLKAGLARTREALGTSLGALVGRRKVDEALLSELESALIVADCGVEAARELIDGLRGRARAGELADAAALKGALRATVTERLAPLERKLQIEKSAGPRKPCVVMIAGVNGSGKTTSIGKLAKWLQQQRLSVMLAAGDTFRAAAREQLAAWGERNGVPVLGQQGGDPGAVVFDAVSAAKARSIDVLIADTAGRLPTQLHLMEEIRKVKRVADKALPGAPHETLLVLDAGTGQNAVAQVRAFDDALGLTGLVVTKLDGTAKGGVLLAIAKARPVPVLFIGVGEGIDDLRPFVAAEFAEALVD